MGTSQQNLNLWIHLGPSEEALGQIHGFHWKETLHDVLLVVLAVDDFFGDRALAGQWPWTSKKPMDEEVHAAVCLEKG